VVHELPDKITNPCLQLGEGASVTLGAVHGFGLHVHEAMDWSEQGTDDTLGRKPLLQVVVHDVPEEIINPSAQLGEGELDTFGAVQGLGSGAATGRETGCETGGGVTGGGVTGGGVTGGGATGP